MQVSPPWKPISVLSLSGQLMQPLRSVLSAPTLVTGVGELVAEMRAGDTGKAEGGGRQQAGGGGGGGGGGRRRGAAAAAAGRPQSLISQSDLRVTPAHNAIQQHHQLFQHEPRFSSFHFTTEPQTIFPAHFAEQLFWARPVSGLRAYCGGGKVVWSVALMPGSRFYLILSHSDHSSFQNWGYLSKYPKFPNMTNIRKIANLKCNDFSLLNQFSLQSVFIIAIHIVYVL